MSLLRHHYTLQRQGKATIERQDGKREGSTIHYYSLVPYYLSSESQNNFSCHEKHRFTDNSRGLPPPHHTHTKGLILVSF